MFLTTELAQEFFDRKWVKVIQMTKMDDAIAAETIGNLYTDEVKIKVYYKLFDTRVEKRYVRETRTKSGVEYQDEDYQFDIEESKYLQSFLLSKLVGEKLEKYKQACIDMRIELENHTYEILSKLRRLEHEEAIKSIKEMFSNDNTPPQMVK